MKKVLLISNYVFHYRLNNYNYFYQQFKEHGYGFELLTFDMQQNVEFDIQYKINLAKKGTFSFINKIKKIRPTHIIFFLHLKDKFFFPLIFYCRLKKIPCIYWNFGVDLREPEAKIKNIFYRWIHNLTNAIVLYSPMEKKYIKEKNLKKTFVGNNTLNFTDINKQNLTDKKYAHNAFGIKEQYIVLFVGKMMPVKRLNWLLQCFRNDKNIAVLIVGKNIPEDEHKIVNNVSNYYYIGEVKYDKNEMHKIFNSIDILCIPGNIGLAICEAFFWGKPVITMKDTTINSPEIWYLKEGENGFIAKDINDMESKTRELLHNRDKYNSFSKKALEVYENYAHIKHMFKGFLDAVEYISS